MLPFPAASSLLPLPLPAGVTDVCSRMLTYAHVCSRMLTYAHVCSRMLHPRCCRCCCLQFATQQLQFVTQTRLPRTRCARCRLLCVANWIRRYRELWRYRAAHYRPMTARRMTPKMRGTNASRLLSSPLGAVCSRMLTYAHVCSRILTYAVVCCHMLTYAHVCISGWPSLPQISLTFAHVYTR
jgi:hypothetical protein